MIMEITTLGNLRKDWRVEEEYSDFKMGISMRENSKVMNLMGLGDSILKLREEKGKR